MIVHKILFSEQDIAARIPQIAQEIIANEANDIVLIAVLKGSFMFAADLARALYNAGSMCALDFIKTNSYHGMETSNSEVKISDILDISVNGKDVILVDDIFDSGKTVETVRKYLYDKGARNVKLCMLLHKNLIRDTLIHVDYIGFKSPNVFVFGYGMDYQHGARCLPYIAMRA